MAVPAYMMNDIIGGGQFGSLMGGAGASYNNPYAAANKRLGGMQNVLNPYYKPYMDYGAGAFQDPGKALNAIGANYHESPGFQFALQQALQAGQHAANAGGMAGSGQNQQQLMGMATNLANQDYNNYLQNALGLQGTAGGIGFNAANAMGGMMGQNLTNQALNDVYSGRSENERNSMLASLLGAAGGAAGMAFGGPVGSMIGSGAGTALSRVFS